jgi:hypothetical protein
MDRLCVLDALVDAPSDDLTDLRRLLDVVAV